MFEPTHFDIAVNQALCLFAASIPFAIVAAIVVQSLTKAGKAAAGAVVRRENRSWPPRS